MSCKLLPVSINFELNQSSLWVSYLFAKLLAHVAKVVVLSKVFIQAVLVVEFKPMTELA